MDIFKFMFTVMHILGLISWFVTFCY